MNRTESLSSGRRHSGGLAFIAAVLLLAAPAAHAQPTKKKGKAKPKQELDGAQLYAVNCNRCHAERYPTEWTAAQWKTILLHMRVRANLPAREARAILKYLQANAGN